MVNTPEITSDVKLLRITLVKSPIGYPKPQKATVRALGLRRMNQTVVHTDSPSLRGMLAKVVHMVYVEEGYGEE